MPIGNIEAFDRTTGNWKLYIERLEQYFLVNDIKEYLKVPTLIALMGGTSYELLVTLCAPQKPSTMTFIDVVKTMSDHLYPKPCILAERYKFRQRKQYNGETISEYVADLKKLAMKCAFKTRLDETLRDQLVCGIHCETTRKRLFAKNSLDFRTALTIAHSLETGDGPTSDCKSDDEGSISRPEFKEDFALTLKLGASDGSSTKFNSDEDDYLTNFVTLGNTISQGKVSAGPNIQCNNDGEVEISLSDYKDDLVIAHGLEANGGQSRDHSTEDAVPMCHSVKSGSGDEGTPKFKRSKVKPWIYVDKFINLKKAEEFLDKENTWSRSSTYITKDGPKRFYRCNKVRKRGRQCAAELCLLLAKYSDDIFVYRRDTEHNHDEIGFRELGIPDLTKVMINSLVDRGLKTKAILEALGEMEGIKLPTKIQLNNYLAVLKRTSKIEKVQLSESEKGSQQKKDKSQKSN